MDFFIAMLIILVFIIVVAVMYDNYTKEYEELKKAVLSKLGFANWDSVPYFDEFVYVKSSRAVESYDLTKHFRENREKLTMVRNKINAKHTNYLSIKRFLNNNSFQSHNQYSRVKKELDKMLFNASSYRICVKYVSPTARTIVTSEIPVTLNTINKFENDPSLLMTKTEYNQFLKEQAKEALYAKQHLFYDRVNILIEYANQHKDSLLIKNSAKQIDDLIAQLFDRTINSIKKVKSADSEEWTLIGSFISHTDEELHKIVRKNEQIIAYYKSNDFKRIKETCDTLMGAQKEFNEYIIEKVDTISSFLGTKVVRNQTINDDEYNYIRPYQKTITPFTAEVSAAVFASAENNPLDYVIKSFYPNKQKYPEQIQKLQLLIDELTTLREAKEIIDNYKKEYYQYITNVPRYVLEEDEAGFYSRLGFANIDESVLEAEYTFSYTSGGGMAKRTFTVPMTEENIVELIHALESKLTLSAFAKEQRILMTSKLREAIKKRDNFTCCNCGNSTHNEANLLLEIDHIVPISKGGFTEESNLQTLCWKCNRSKGSKI